MSEEELNHGQDGENGDGKCAEIQEQWSGYIMQKQNSLGWKWDCIRVSTQPFLFVAVVDVLTAEIRGWGDVGATVCCQLSDHNRHPEGSVSKRVPVAGESRKGRIKIS